MSLCLQPKPNFVIIDGCARLWNASSPANSTIKDLGDAFHYFVLLDLTPNTDVYLLLDGYYKYPINGHTRAEKRVHSY